MNEGVIVGVDRYQEWLLPWWWHHYEKKNSHPVTFIDFGMSEEMKTWCKSKGRLNSLEAPKEFVYSSSLVDKELIQEWEARVGQIEWHARSQRFCKPFALLQTPYEKTVWFDLDCEVIGPIAPLFHKIHTQAGMALSNERPPSSEEVAYNSGVVVYHKESPLLHKWAEGCRVHNDRFLSDQEVLGFIINAENVEIAELSDKYNWRLKLGVNHEAVVLHWTGAWGKEVLRRERKRMNLL